MFSKLNCLINLNNYFCYQFNGIGPQRIIDMYSVWYTAARLAQLVEHETLNLRVVGSSPTLGNYILYICSLLHFLLQVSRQFSMDFNLFRSFRSQKSHSSSEAKSSKLPGIKELDQPTTSASESTTTTETEDIPTVAMENAGTQTGSTESSHKSDPDLVLVDNTPPADGDDCKCVCVFVCVCVCVCICKPTPRTSCDPALFHIQLKRGCH